MWEHLFKGSAKDSDGAEAADDEAGPYAPKDEEEAE